MPQILQQATAILENEKLRRNKFVEDLTDEMKAEFINGEVIIHSPLYYKHGIVNDNLFQLIQSHITKHQLGAILQQKFLCRFTRNDYEPDISFWNSEKSKHFRIDQAIFPPPDFIVEILSKATKNRDYTVKFEDYALHGVKEYWIIDSDPVLFFIEQYILKGKKFKLHKKLSEGFILSPTIKELSFPVEILLDINATQEFLEEGTYLKGREEGMKAEKITIAQKMLSLNIDIEQITTITGLTRKEIIKIKNTQF